MIHSVGMRNELFIKMVLSESVDEFDFYYYQITGAHGRGTWYYIYMIDSVRREYYLRSKEKNEHNKKKSSNARNPERICLP